MEEKKAGILKLMPITFVNNDNQEVKVIQQEKDRTPAKKMIAMSNCYFKFTEEERQTFFESYWKMGDSQKQKQFVANNVTACDKERERIHGNASQSRNRQSTMTYHLVDVAVCKTMFLQTLCVGETFGRNVLKKCNSQTGIVKDRKKKQIKDEGN